MKVLPPGTILQLMYLKKRLSTLKSGRFIEIGPGSGEITSCLLKEGWTGTVCDLEEITIQKINTRFKKEIESGRLKVILGDYLELSGKEDAELIISSMVMEHLDENQETEFMRVSKQHLSAKGKMIGLVPASPKHWGIEDEIAGHFRRYTEETLRNLLDKSAWKLNWLTGLTFPLSNILLPISNFLVRRAESAKLKLTNFEKTKKSGCREVSFKTKFPPILTLIINPIVLLPFYGLQKIFGHSKKSLVIYFEASPSKE